MSNTNDEIVAKVKVFFSKIAWKKILAFLFFVLLSSIFWVMQVYRQKYEGTLRIPVKYTNVPDSIVFDTDLPTEIHARIKDDGALMFKYYFTKQNDSLEINVREIVSQAQSKTIQGRIFEQMIRNKLFISSELIGYSPARVSYTYSVLHQKKMPVIYDGYVSLAPGYIIDGDLSVNPDSVTVFGNKAILDTMHYAHTPTDTINNIHSTQEVSIPLKNMKGIKYTPNSILLSIPVDEFTQKEMDIPIECINVPKNIQIKFFPSIVKVQFYVGLKRFNDINNEDFKIIIDYNQINQIKDISSSIPIRISESPDYVRTRPPIPTEVEFVLEQE